MSPHIGRSVQRLEDVRFLTGRGRYVADIASPGCLWGHVLRSPHAHALIKRIDVARASAIAGVCGVYTSADLAELGPMPCLAAVTPLIVPPRPALAVGRVRHVGMFAALEDQLCGLTLDGGYSGPGRSPDRADALVWALSALMLGRKGKAAIREL